MLPVSGDAHRVAQHCLAEYLATGATEFRVGVGEMASRLGLHRNTVGKALAALTEGGILQRSDWRGRGTARMTLALVLGPQHVPCAATTVHAAPATAAPRTRRKAPDLGSYQAALERAVSHRDAVLLSTYQAAGTPEAWVPRPEWGLTDADVAAIRAFIPNRSQDPRPAVIPATAAAPVTIEPVPQQLSLALKAAAPVLRIVARGDEDAVKQYLKEIAYSVLRGGLGRGDLDAGVRHAIKIVQSGRWGTPRGMTDAWNPDLSAVAA